MLSAERVSFVAAARPLVRDVSLELAPGEVVGVIGPNGAGKSTLLRLLCHELDPSSGTVTLDGKALSQVPRAERARRIAVLPQHAALDFPYTGQEVIGMGRLPAGTSAVVDRRVVDEVVAFTGVEALARSRYTTLSGGERQWIHIARVFAQLWDRMDGAVFLMDEPTAPLDLAHQLRLADMIGKVRNRGAAILVVMHDIDLASRLADRLALLAGGALERLGDPASVLTPDALRRAYGVEADIGLSPAGTLSVFARQVSADD